MEADVPALAEITGSRDTVEQSRSFLPPIGRVPPLRLQPMVDRRLIGETRFP